VLPLQSRAARDLKRRASVMTSPIGASSSISVWVQSGSHWIRRRRASWEKVLSLVLVVR